MKRFATLVTVFALSLGFSAGSLAHEKGADNPHHAQAMTPMFHSRAFDRLRDELKLDASQEALWKEARDFVRGQRDAMRERFRKERAEIETLLGQPDADLRGVAKRMDEMRSERLKQHDAARERWFTVYDSLSAGQKEKARLFFKSGMERMGKQFQGRRDHSRRGPRHHPDVSAPAQ
jgi:Spy/CpxP family protein refolding chaperone